MGGNMVSPDMEMVHDEMARIYFMGRLWTATRMADGWKLNRPNSNAPWYTGESIEDCITWLITQVNY